MARRMRWPSMAGDLWKRPPAQIIEERIRFQTIMTVISVTILCALWAGVLFITVKDALNFFYLGYVLGTFTMASGFIYLKLMRKNIRADPYSGPEQAVVAAFKAAGFCVPFFIASFPFGGLPPFSGVALAVAIIYYNWGRWGSLIPGQF